MSVYFERPGIAVHCGDVRAVCRALPANFVQTVVTSPPYWGLRDYGVPPSIWGGDPDCKHRFKPTRLAKGGGSTSSFRRDRKAGLKRGTVQPGFCRCGAWKGCYGLEPTPELFVEHTVEIFREVRRVLRDDGTLWLNLGDSYANDAKGYRGGRGSSTLTGDGNYQHEASPPELQKGWRQSLNGLKRKDLIGIPWMVAFALRADGWNLRSDVVWSKRNTTPQSVRDRPTSAHEHIFLLSKKPKYFYDVVGSSEVATGEAPGNRKHKAAEAYEAGDRLLRRAAGFTAMSGYAQRQMRSVWSMSSAPYKGAHFAAFPPELVRRCLSAGVNEFGCCAACGSPWRRIVERVRMPTRTGKASKVNAIVLDPNSPYAEHRGKIAGNRDPKRHVTLKITKGWERTCKCEAAAIEPCRVFDPFHGAGTTMCVAQRLGLEYVGAEIKPDYVDQSIVRLETPIVFPHERVKTKRRRRVREQRELFTIEA